MKILVADDSRLARLSLIKTLKEFKPDAVFFEAENGAIAVEVFTIESPKIVFLDLTMPIMDGYDALNHIMQIDPAANVIVVSADIQTQAQAQVLAAGAKMMVPKPINSNKMSSVLQQLSF